MMKPLFIIAVATLVFVSCRPTRKIQTAIAKKDTTTTVSTPAQKEDSSATIHANYQKLREQKISYTTFSAKVDVDYVGGDGKKESANANLRMYKDSVIWISVTGLFNIEGLRAYITKDSI